MAVDRAEAARALESFLRAIGRDPQHDAELRGTAERVTTMFVEELLAGYDRDPRAVVAPHVCVGTTAVVVLRDISVTTMCPHHLLPATGVGSVAFGPRDKLVGLGVMAELLDVLARRLTLQEQIGEEVAKTLVEALDARWACCRLLLRHGCVSARGEEKHEAQAETVAFVGEAAYRAEAMMVVGAGT